MHDDHHPHGPRRAAAAAVVALLLLVPLMVLRAVTGQAWRAGEFVLLGAFLAAILLVREVAVRVPTRHARAAGLAIAVAASLLQLWANLAVGIIGSEDHPANLWFTGVVALALVGMALAGGCARAMAWAMRATAAAQGAAFVAALALGLGFTGPVTLFFAAMWLAAASLFQRAATVVGPARRA